VTKRPPLPSPTSWTSSSSRSPARSRPRSLPRHPGAPQPGRTPGHRVRREDVVGGVATVLISVMAVLPSLLPLLLRRTTPSSRFACPTSCPSWSSSRGLRLGASHRYEPVEDRLSARVDMPGGVVVACCSEASAAERHHVPLQGRSRRGLHRPHQRGPAGRRRPARGASGRLRVHLAIRRAAGTTIPAPSTAGWCWRRSPGTTRRTPTT